MKIIYYQSPSGNFGDDLNAILWRELLPESCLARDDDVVLLGIGSIFRDDFLSEQATRGKRVFVLGSGAGTGPLPRRWPHADWSVLAVRGPLTAKLIGRPETAATDSAMLLATTRLLPARSPRDVVFIPHYNSVSLSRWKEVCELAGFVFIDAHWPPQDVLRAMGRARLVVTEAMHGAIVADALRIPWIPVVCSPSIAAFKWIDWTRSLELDYRPISLPPSSGWEALKHFKIRWTEPKQPRRHSGDGEELAMMEDFRQRFAAGRTGGTAVVYPSMEQIANAPVLNRSILRTRVKAGTQRIATLADSIIAPRAAEALIKAARGRTYLSDDRTLDDRISRLQDGLSLLKRALAA